jgi:26S proteasome non-ATPase regulatory subunit 10
MLAIKQISTPCPVTHTILEELAINSRDSHRAATTGSTGFVTLLLHPPEGSPKTRLNTGDRMGTLIFSHFTVELKVGWEGNTSLHLAMESAHGETAALLIEAGADRSRVSHRSQDTKYSVTANMCFCVMLS